MSGSNKPINLDGEQRSALLRLSGLYKESLGDDFSSDGLMVNYCWANYLQKLWVAAEREVGIMRDEVAGHRRASLAQIEKLEGHWPKAEAVLTALAGFGEVDAELAEAIRRDVARQQAIPLPGARDETSDVRSEVNMQLMGTPTIEDQLRVLVVDDDPVTNKIITRYLTRYGHRVHSAEDGQAALAMFQSGEYDAVISDIMMPKMDGWELAAALRAGAPELPILLITAYSAGGGSWNQEDLKSRGVDALLNKPIDFQHLLGLLEDIKLRKEGGKK